MKYANLHMHSTFSDGGFTPSQLVYIGKALAHPYKQTRYVEKLVGYGLNGIEISHPELYENTSYLALQAADAFGLYHCGGTDHLGPMSGGGGNLAIPTFNGITEEEFTAIKERRLG